MNQTISIEKLTADALRNDANAQLELGMRYLNGDGVDVDLKVGATWLGDAAKKGNREAQFRVALCYAEGVGADKSPQIAASFYRKAADQGHAAAQNNLGICYAGGDGVKRDYAEAIKWLVEAAMQNVDEARGNLFKLAKQCMTLPKYQQKRVYAALRLVSVEKHEGEMQPVL